MGAASVSQYSWQQNAIKLVAFNNLGGEIYVALSKSITCNIYLLSKDILEGFSNPMLPSSISPS